MSLDGDMPRPLVYPQGNPGRGRMASRKRAAKRPVKSKTLAKTRAPRKKASSRNVGGKLTYQDGRWRRGGRFVSPPLASKVRRDALGRPLDDAGRLVPASSLRGKAPKHPSLPPRKPSKAKPAKPVKAPKAKPAKPAKAPKAKPVKAPVAPAPKPKPVRQLRTPRVERIEPGSAVVNRNLVSSFGINRREPSQAADILENVIEAHARKGPFEAQDVTLWSYGIMFVGPDKLSAETIGRIDAQLPKGAKVKIADTRAGTEVYLSFTSKTGHVLDQAKDRLEDNMPKIQQIYNELLDWWGADLDWYTWAETDDELY